MKRMIAVIMMIVLCFPFAGCGIAAKQETTGTTLKLYYATDPEKAKGGDAVGCMETDWTPYEDSSVEEQADTVLNKLLETPEDEKLYSIFPENVSVREIKSYGTTVVVDFSSAYSLLSGMDLTIANYCVALSLTQIPTVRLIRILVNGKIVEYWNGNLFMANDVLLTSTEDVVRSFVAKLYFPKEGAGLESEESVLTMYEGQSQAEVVFNALKDGPTDSALKAFLPEEFELLNSRIEETVCYLNFSGEEESYLEGNGPQAIRCIVASLCSLQSIDSVQILVDGELASMYASVNISEPLIYS